MQAFELQSNAGLDALVLVDRPLPEPQFGEVLVRVRAASLNYRDLLIARGAYSAKQQYPRIPLSDGAGEVVAVGAGVTRMQVGDRVAGTFFPDWLAGDPTRENTRCGRGSEIDGMLAEEVAIAADSLVKLPEHLSYEEGATLPCAAVTAWQALVEVGRVTAGETVLLLGTGGVSIFGLQIAQLLGARAIVTSSSDEKLARARELGAAETINYRTLPDWDKRVYELTQRRGVDLVVEVGGAGTLEKSLRAVRAGGRVSLIGVLAGPGEVNPLPITMKSLSVSGIYVGSRETFERMNRAIALHQLRPVVDRVFPFAEAIAAYRYLESGAHFGKVVVGV